MGRVTWPSRKEVYATTVVVILTSIFLGVYLWGVDLILDSSSAGSTGTGCCMSTLGAA